jgi:hypothetical protein
VIQRGLSRLGFEYSKGPHAGAARLPNNGIKITNFNSSQSPVKVITNEVASQDFNEKEIRIRETPAAVAIY